jgi:hypothetical protein
LAITHHRRTSQEALRRILYEAGRRSHRSVATMRNATRAVDCPDGLPGPFPSRSVWLTVR